MSISFWIDGDPIVELGPDEGDGYGPWMGREHEMNMGAGNTHAVLTLLGIDCSLQDEPYGELDPDDTWERLRRVLPLAEDHPHARRLVSLQEIVRHARMLGEPVLYA